MTEHLCVDAQKSSKRNITNDVIDLSLEFRVRLQSYQFDLMFDLHDGQFQSPEKITSHRRLTIATFEAMQLTYFTNSQKLLITYCLINTI